MRLLKAETVAEVLNISTPRAYELMREKILPTVRLGRQVRVSENALEQFVASGGKALPGGWRREPDRTEVG